VEDEEEDFECDGDCENCEYQEEVTEEGEIPYMLTNDLLEALQEIDEDDHEAVYDLIVEFMGVAYNAGKQDTISIAKHKLEEI
jgi:hypothetical protein